MSLPVVRNECESRPTHRRIMSLLSMAVIPEERGAFRKRFRVATKHNDRRHLGFLCQTPISFVGKAFGCGPLQLRLAADMFPESRIESEVLNEFYVMDVILNWAPSPEVTGKCRKRGTKNHGGGSPDINCDVVRPVLSYKPEDLGAEKDYLYGVAILFLPKSVVCFTVRGNVAGEIPACRARSPRTA